MAEATSESVAGARRIRRQRKLDQVEIPEEHLFITNDLLGKGGFGEVYLADYNGHNAAAKVRNSILVNKNSKMDTRNAYLTESCQRWTERPSSCSRHVCATTIFTFHPHREHTYGGARTFCSRQRYNMPSIPYTHRVDRPRLGYVDLGGDP